MSLQYLYHKLVLLPFPLLDIFFPGEEGRNKFRLSVTSYHVQAVQYTP